MTNPMLRLYQRLNSVGFSQHYVQQTILPSWWDDEAANNPTGLYQAMSLISRHTGISLATLRASDSSLQLNASACKFKKLASTDEDELDVARSLALQVAKLAAGAITTPVQLPNSAETVRQAILAQGKPWVSLGLLVSYCWSIGIPVIYIASFPENVKVMHGLAAVIDNRPVIVIGRRQIRTAWFLFDVAHELGHIICKHVNNNAILVDEEIAEGAKSDPEEREADQFAIDVICGNSQGRIISATRTYSPASLVAQAKQVGDQKQIDPGHIILNYAHSMENAWAVAAAALNLLEPNRTGPDAINRHATAKMQWEDLSSDDAEFITKMTQGIRRN